MAASHCPLCGYRGDDFVFDRGQSRGLVCPRCGEVEGEAGAKAVDVEERALLAGTALAGVGGLNLVAGLLWLAFVVFSGVRPPEPRADQSAAEAAGARVGAFMGQYGPGVVSGAFGLIELLGGIQFARRRMRPLAVFSTLAAILPCTCGFVLSLPIGIWGLVVLFQPAVRAAYR